MPLNNRGHFTISQLIAKLTDLQAQHGDLPVWCCDAYSGEPFSPTPLDCFATIDVTDTPTACYLSMNGDDNAIAEVAS